MYVIDPVFDFFIISDTPCLSQVLAFGWRCWRWCAFRGAEETVHEVSRRDAERRPDAWWYRSLFCRSPVLRRCWSSPRPRLWYTKGSHPSAWRWISAVQRSREGVLRTRTGSRQRGPAPTRRYCASYLWCSASLTWNGSRQETHRRLALWTQSRSLARDPAEQMRSRGSDNDKHYVPVNRRSTTNTSISDLTHYFVNDFERNELKMIYSAFSLEFSLKCFISQTPSP